MRMVWRENGTNWVWEGIESMEYMINSWYVHVQKCDIQNQYYLQLITVNEKQVDEMIDILGRLM
jgi:hypothetical protein